MSEEMLLSSKIHWAEEISSTESPVDLCLQKGVPAYIKVRRDSQLVYRYFRASVEAGLEIDSLPFEGFHEELLFLRLDNSYLVEIAISRSACVSSFSHEGFSTPRPYCVTGHTERGSQIRSYEDIKEPTLKVIEFDRAFLIDRAGWESALSSMKNSLRFGRALQACTPEDFKLSVDVVEGDLYFRATDIDALRKAAQQDPELASYPFEHKERMPGIYWMFQAAYAHRHLKMELDQEKNAVENWLGKNVPKNTYRYRSSRTANKFVWPTVDRAKGGKDRGEFNLEDLDEWTVREPYEFPFISKGLSFILAIADWWEKVIQRNTGQGKLLLAEMLDRNNFGGLEIGDLVYLISGSQMTKEENTLFKRYLSGKRVRRAVDQKL